MAEREAIPSGPGAAPAREDALPAPHPIAALLRKDWAVLRPRYRAGIVLVFVMAALQTVRSDEAYLWVGVALAGGVAMLVPVVEWRAGADRLVASLPAARRHVVVARYLAAGIACGAAWAIWAAAGAALGPFLDGGTAGPGIWATLPGALTFFFVVGVLLAVFLPLHFAIGLGRAAAVFLPVALVLILMGRSFVAAVAPVPADAADLALRLGAPGAVTRWALATLVGRVGTGAAVALSAIKLLGMWAISAWLSTLAYRRRGL